MPTRPPRSESFEIAVVLGGASFLYLLLTGVTSPGLGEALPTVVSRIFFGGILCAAIGTAVVNAYLGGNFETSVAPPLAVAGGLGLFLVTDTVFRLNATVSDLSVEFTVLSYLVIALVGGGVAFLLGAGLRWGANRVFPSA